MLQGEGVGLGGGVEEVELTRSSDLALPSFLKMMLWGCCCQMLPTILKPFCSAVVDLCSIPESARGSVFPLFGMLLHCYRKRRKMKIRKGGLSCMCCTV